MPVTSPNDIVDGTPVLATPSFSRRRLIGAMAAAALVPRTATAASRDPAVDQAIAAVEGTSGTNGKTLAALMADANVPGIGVAVIRDFKVAWTRHWGIADRQTGAPVTDRTLFQAASMSKPVAAMVSLKAVERGYFGLDQDVNTILKSWQLPNDPFPGGGVVTPRMLMSHTSGTGDGYGFPGYEPGAPLPTLPELLDGRKPSPQGPVRLVRPAGMAMQYSGGGVEIQQLALTDAVGRPFAALADDWVLRPIGMLNSSFEQPLPPALQAFTARAHDKQGAAMNVRWHVYPEQAAAGLWTTAADYARFMIEVQLAVAGRSNRVIGQATARNMITPVGVGPFAVGFEVMQIGQGWYFEHGGSNWGFRSEAIAHFSKGYGLVMMANGETGRKLFPEIQARVAAAYAWDTLDQAPPR